MTPTSIMDFIDEYIEGEHAKYENNKQNNALTFGKWKGFTVKELSANDKGKSYLEWLLTQTWFSPDKFSSLHYEIKSLGIKKKPTKRATLN